MTLVGLFSWPRTIFGIMILLGLGYFIAINFAAESRGRLVPWAVGIIGVLPFVAIFLRGMRRLARRSDAWVWRGAGRRGAFLLWQKFKISGEQARRFWLMQVICSGVICISLTGGTVLRLQKVPPPQVASPQLAKEVNAEDQKRAREEQPFRDLAEQAKPLVAECRRLGQPAGRVTQVGKAVILDMESGGRREAHDDLPEALRGSPSGADLTLWLVAGKNRIPVAAYHPSKAGDDRTDVPGYRVDLDLAIVRWPSKKPIGIVRVRGEDPPDTVNVNQWTNGDKPWPAALTGPIDSPLAKWVASRPMEGGPDPVSDGLALADQAAGQPPVTVHCQPGGDTFAYEQDNSAPKLKGRALLWDVARDRPVERVNRSLPEQIRGQVSDPDLTLFMVTRQDVEVTKRWTFLNGTGSIEGYLVYWPEKKLVGRFKLICDDLFANPETGYFQPDGQVAVNPETGLDDALRLKLVKWIKTLVMP